MEANKYLGKITSERVSICVKYCLESKCWEFSRVESVVKARKRIRPLIFNQRPVIPWIFAGCLKTYWQYIWMPIANVENHKSWVPLNIFLFCIFFTEDHVTKIEKNIKKWHYCLNLWSLYSLHSRIVYSKQDTLLLTLLFCRLP